MDIVIALLKQTILTILRVVDIAILVRVVLSWFYQGEETRITVFLYTVTEPAIQPLRKLFYKMNWFQQTPIDMPLLFTVLLISFLETLIRLL